jgi:hypothetical protein
MGDAIHELLEREYQYGFTTDLDTDIAPKGLTEEVIRLISAKNGEPEWLLEWRMAAAQRSPPAHRLPEHELLGRAQDQGSAEGSEPLGKLAALAGVGAYPMRVKCATLAWHTLREALDADPDVTRGSEEDGR